MCLCQDREDAIIAGAPAAASAQALRMRRAGARLAAEAPRELAAVLAGFLGRVCAAGTLGVPDRAARTPEALGLRPLPQFASLAAAQKARIGIQFRGQGCLRRWRPRRRRALLVA